MSNRDRDFLTRTEIKRRSNKTQGRKKLDRLLNVLIAIVAVLIIINLYFVFSNNDEKAQDENNNIESNQSSNLAAVNNEEENNQSNTSNEESNSTSNEDSEENVNNESNEASSNETNTENSNPNEQAKNGNLDESNESENTTTTNSDSVIVQDSDDPLVKQIIIDPNWHVTPTKQMGVHVSTYEEGHIDYEEKKVTIRNAVGLNEDDVIYWSVRNNGSSENSIAVVSSIDKQQKYRVSIEWVANQGWKPVKIERLNVIEGAY